MLPGLHLVETYANPPETVSVTCSPASCAVTSCGTQYQRTEAKPLADGEPCAACVNHQPQAADHVRISSQKIGIHRFTDI